MGPVERGRSRAAQGVNVAMRYIEDENGQIIDGHRAGEMRKIARSVWVALANAGKAPAKWSQADIVSAEAYRKEMRQHFPELRLCEHDWKADLIASENYPSWYSHQSNQHKRSVKQEDAGVPSLHVSPGSHSAKRPQHDDQGPLNIKKKRRESATAATSSPDITTTTRENGMPSEVTTNVALVTESTAQHESAASGTITTAGENNVVSTGAVNAASSVAATNAACPLKVCAVRLDILCTCADSCTFPCSLF
jgi:hypothetical protein